MSIKYTDLEATNSDCNTNITPESIQTHLFVVEVEYTHHCRIEPYTRLNETYIYVRLNETYIYVRLNETYIRLKEKHTFK